MKELEICWKSFYFKGTPTAKRNKSNESFQARKAWKLFNNSEITAGFHVHHIDKTPTNNSPEKSIMCFCC